MKKRLTSVMSLMLCVAILLLGCVKHPAVPYEVYEGTIHTQQGVFIDTETNILRFSEDAVLEYGSTQLPIGGMEFELSGVNDGDKLYYHTDAQKIYPFDAHQSVYLGTYRIPCFLTELNMDSPLLYVDERNAAELVGLKDKTVACLGDSMTSGYSSTPGYPEFLPLLLGTENVLSYGQSGSCIAQDSLGSYLNDYYTRAMTEMEDADIVIVLGGINDWSYGRDLENEFQPAMKKLCAGLKEKYPNAQIYVFSSPESNPAEDPAKDLDGTPWEGNTEGYNCVGKLLTDYANVMQTVCEEEGVHFYSLTEALCWEVFDGEIDYSSAQKSAMVAELISEYILKNYNP